MEVKNYERRTERTEKRGELRKGRKRENDRRDHGRVITIE